MQVIFAELGHYTYTDCKGHIIRLLYDADVAIKFKSRKIELYLQFDHERFFLL